MKPGVKIVTGKKEVEDFLIEQDIPFQEQFIKQVKDDSLPADQILTEQKEGHSADDLPSLFVP
jgi:hypothetical protein